MGREARKGARVIACRSIEPEQSLGPLTKPVCARMGSDGRDGNWHRCVKGLAGRGGSSNRRESYLQAHGRGDRRSHRPARSLITEDGGDRGYRRLGGGGCGGGL